MSEDRTGDEIIQSIKERTEKGLPTLAVEKFALDMHEHFVATMTTQGTEGVDTKVDTVDTVDTGTTANFLDTESKDAEIQEVAKALTASLDLMRAFNEKHPLDEEKAWQRRLMNERGALRIKYEKLDEFLEECEASADSIDDGMKLLFAQRTAMATYGAILDRRIELI